jgi:addiction module HigA family antidote
MIRIPTHREPTHPGEMLLEEFLNPMGLTQRDLADAIHVPYQRVNELVNGRRGVTPSTALRLAKYFGMSVGPVPCVGVGGGGAQEDQEASACWLARAT